MSKTAKSAFGSELFHRVALIIPFIAVCLPVALLGGYTLRIATESVQELVEAENISASRSIEQLLTQEIDQSIELSQAMSSGSGTINAIATHDLFRLTERFKYILLAFPKIDRAFVTGPDETLWHEYHQKFKAVGKDYSGYPWHQDVRANGGTAISGVYQRSAEHPEPVIAIANRIQTASGSHILVFEHHLKQLSEWLRTVRLSGKGYLYVVDHTGQLVAHPDLSMNDLGQQYTVVDQIQRATTGSMETTTYIDPLREEEMIATFVTVNIGGHNWVIVAQQPTSIAYSALRLLKLNIGVASGILFLFTLAVVIFFARMNRKLMEMKSDFISFVSHQLKAPVTAMRWMIEGMLDGDDGEIPAAAQETLHKMQDVNASNYKLIADILNASRIDRGVIAVETVPTPLREVVELAVRDYRVSCERNGLYLNIVEEEEGIYVKTDASKAAEAVSNSVSNAIKYTERGGITITLSKEGKFGKIAVADTGKGMSPEMLGRLFTRDKVVGSGTSAEKSAGLGLYIGKNFMNLQGGDMWAESVEGQGSTFFYTLPLCDLSEGESVEVSGAEEEVDVEDSKDSEGS